jgi:hypothetical protein
MRRTMLYISLSLFTFTLGFLTVGPVDDMALALPIALIVFILLKKVTALKWTLHYFKVVLLTLLIWTPFAALTLSVVLPKTESCIVEFSYEGEDQPPVVEEGEAFIRTQNPQPVECFGMPAGYRGENETNTIWAGVIDDKAISKPAPHDARLMKAQGIASIVAVSVIVDATTGKVRAAQALSGHPLARRPAVEAAYRARFHPSTVCGVPPNVSGILTYRF